MRYASTLIAVNDIEKSKHFYHNVLGLNVVADFGANVTLDGGIVLQTLNTWKSFIKRMTLLCQTMQGNFISKKMIWRRSVIIFKPLISIMFTNCLSIAGGRESFGFMTLTNT